MSLSRTKLLSVLVIGLFIGASFIPMIDLKAEESKDCDDIAGMNKENFIEISLKSNPYQIKEVTGGVEICMDNYGSILNPGEPKLPSKIFYIGVPPGSEVNSVEIVNKDKEVIPGFYDVVPNIGFSNGIETISSEKKSDIYSSDMSYPSLIYEFVGMGQMRKYSFAKIRFNPISYIPAIGELTLYKEVTLKINYETVDDVSDEVLSDSVMENMASEKIVNYESIHSLYSTDKTEDRDTYNYVIITTDGLQDDISNLKSWKESQEYSVKIVTKTWILSNYGGADSQEKIRNFLIDKYIDWEIEYVLIASSNDTIPMRMCYPNKDDHAETVITDYYYADLTGNWDSDNDGYYGERGDDNVDFNPEVWVGRIPFDNEIDVNEICQNIVSFEQSYGGWKKKAMLLGAISNYKYEDGNYDLDKTDNAEVMEEIKNDILIGNSFSSTTMYEKEGLNCSTFLCDFPLNHNNVLSEWADGYGLVLSKAHSNAYEMSRKIWLSDDNSNGLADEDEISWTGFYDCEDAGYMNHPSLIYENGCNIYDPDFWTDNLVESGLKQGASGIIATSGYGWYSVGWDDESYGGTGSMQYFFVDNYIENSQSFGVSLYNSKLHYLNNYDWWGWKIYENMYGFNLFGDPSLLAISPPPDINIDVTPNNPRMGDWVNVSINCSNQGYIDNLFNNNKAKWQADFIDIYGENILEDAKNFGKGLYTTAKKGWGFLVNQELNSPGVSLFVDDSGIGYGTRTICKEVDIIQCNRWAIALQSTWEGVTDSEGNDKSRNPLNVKNFLISNGWDSNHIYQEHKTSINKNDVIEAFGWLEGKVSEGDLVVIWVGSHGFNELYGIAGLKFREAGNYWGYGEVPDIAESYLGDLEEELEKNIGLATGEYGLLFVSQACHSGGAKSPLQDIGRIVMSSCKAHQSSTTACKFSYELKDGFEGLADEESYGGNKNYVISAEEAFNYASRTGSSAYWEPSNYEGKTEPTWKDCYKSCDSNSEELPIIIDDDYFNYWFANTGMGITLICGGVLLKGIEGFHVDPSCQESIITLYWNDSQDNFNLSLENPNGLVINHDDVDFYENISLFKTNTTETYIIKNPDCGEWNAFIDGPSGEEYILFVSANTSLNLNMSLNKKKISKFGSIVINATLNENENPVVNSDVTAHIIKPDNTSTELQLFDDGFHNDSEKDDGIYCNEYNDINISGNYLIYVNATGEIDNDIYTRESPIQKVNVIFKDPNSITNSFYNGSVNQSVDFNGSKSYDLDGEIIEYLWEFGDGNTSSDINPFHEYSRPGIYNVTLEVTDNDGLKNTCDTIAIIGIPKLRIIYPDITNLVNNNCTIKWIIYNSIDDNLFLNISYSDDFGNNWQILDTGIPNIGQYGWNSIGLNDSLYLLKIDSNDSYGNHIEDTCFVNLIEKPKKPIGPLLGTVDKSYSFSTMKNVTDGNPLFYNFSWGDDNYSGWIGPYSANETCSATYNWSNPGIYNITVRAKYISGYLGPYSSSTEIEIISSGETSVNQSEFDRGFPIRHAVDGDWAGAQNFTPSVSTITKVCLYARVFGTPEFDLTVELREDGPQGTLLDSVSFSPGEVPSSWTWLEVDFSDVTVQPDTDYFIVCPPAPSGVTTSFGYEWGYAFGNQYDDGSFWFTRDGGGLWRDLPTMYEFCFKTYGYD